jgi:acetyl-CoA carboxylase biotin carboxyl carrier protein
VELKQIKELMSAMGRTGMRRLSLKKVDFELVLEKEDNESFKSLDSMLETDDYPLKHEAVSRANAALSRGKELTSPLGSAEVSHNEKESSHGSYITSPMVGTFYSSPSPDDPPFVKAGDKVEKGTVVCIIEAMKVMNEVKAPASGVVAEALIESGHPVEFGTKLFKII